MMKKLSLLSLLAVLTLVGCGNCDHCGCGHSHDHDHTHVEHAAPKKAGMPKGALKQLQFKMKDFMQNMSDATMLNGFVQLEDKEFNRIMINGTARLKKVTVSDAIMVNGDFNAKESTFKNIRVNGKTSINDTKVTGDTAVAGFLVARRSTFNDVTVASDKIIFEQVQAGVVKIADNKSDKKQVVEITGGTIAGDIVFEKAGGSVILKGDAQVTGKIIGANVTK